MRIRQLDLLRYGHFTDASIALPPSTPDIHLVLGENEAGKSTAMAGIEDLLFGIPSNSPRNFLHEYGAMRVGATLEKGATHWRCAEGKATRTHCSPSKTCLSHRVRERWRRILPRADRRFYARMFSSITNDCVRVARDSAGAG